MLLGVGEGVCETDNFHRKVPRVLCEGEHVRDRDAPPRWDFAEFEKIGGKGICSLV